MSDEKIPVTIHKSFGFNGINDNEMRRFEAWGSVEVVDRQNEVIPAEEVYRIMDIWMDRGAPLQYMHTNRNVGKGLNWQKAEKNGKKGVLITGVIYKHYKEDDKLWKGIVNGDYEGLSIGGNSYKKERDEKTGSTFLRNLIGYEFSVVDRCGNQEATFTDVNMMAKSEDKTKKEVKKEDPVMDENPNTELGDKMSALENMMSSLIEKIAMIEEKISGAPAKEDAVEDTKADTTGEDEKDKDKPEDEVTKKEVAKTDDKTETKSETDGEGEKVTKLQGEVSDLKKEMSELKKSTVVKTIETKRPDEVKKDDKHTSVRKSLKDMAKEGKIDFSTLGNEMRGE